MNIRHLCRPAYIATAALALSVPTTALAQPVEPPPETLGAPDALPPLPSPDADFKKDQGLFGDQVETDPEAVKAAFDGQQQVEGRLPTYARYPTLTYTTQAIAGVLAAGVVGLAAGNLGDAIDPGDPLQPLGGYHGPAIAGLLGTGVGSALGVWGAGLLFEKNTHPGWVALGAAAGSAVGTGTAIGIAALGDADTGTAALAVGSALLFQVGGAILFGELFKPPPPPRSTDRSGLIELPDDL